MNNEKRYMNEQCTMNNVQWKKVKLGEVGEIVTGSTPTTTKQEYWNGEYNFYSPADFDDSVYCVKTERTVTKAGIDTGRCIPENSIMVACIASIGKLSVNRTEGITNQQINTIVPNADYDYIFLYYLLLFNVEKIKGRAAQTTIPIINKEDFSNLEFSVPDLAAQRRIAAILSSADKVIDSTQRLIEKYKKMKQGMMEELLNEQCTMNNVQWKKVRLGEVCEDIFSGKNTTRQDFGKYVVYGSTGPIGYSDDYEYDFDAVLVARVGANAGLVNKVSGLYDVSDNTLIIKIFKNIDLNYLYYLLIRLNLNQFIFGSGQPLVTAGLLKKIGIPIPYKNDDPDLSEQRRIAKILSGIDAKIAAEEKVLEKYIQIKKGLMEKLLNEK